MFKNTLKLNIVLAILWFSSIIDLNTAETYMITRTKNGDVIRTDLTKPKTDWETYFKANEIENFQVIKRSLWLEQAPENMPEKLETPVHHVIIMSTDTELCTTAAICTWQVRVIQGWNLEQLIPYNFMIGGDGHVYEGRGWDYRGDHPTNGYKIEDTISIAYLGTNKRKEPTQKQIRLAQLLLSEGVRLQKLTNDYNVHAVFNIKSSNILPQAATVICENMHSDKHQCSELLGNNDKLN